MTRTPRAPFPWFGGKQALVPMLLDVLPPHEVYVEPFGGAASLLLSKPPCEVEVYNDLDSGLVTFFRVLRDPAQGRRLRELLELTPYSREEYLDCRETWEGCGDAVEQARRWFVGVAQDFSSHMGARSGWGYNVRAVGASRAQAFRTKVASLEAFGRRLGLVQIEHRPALEVLRTYDQPGALFYCDPPYLPETRSAGGYRHEMTRANHADLLDFLVSCQAMVLLSGYDAPLYRERLSGWACSSVAVYCTAINGRMQAHRQRRRECVWIKPNARRRQMALAWDGEAVDA